VLRDEITKRIRSSIAEVYAEQQRRIEALVVASRGVA